MFSTENWEGFRNIKLMLMKDKWMLDNENKRIFKRKLMTICGREMTIQTENYTSLQRAISRPAQKRLLLEVTHELY